MDHFNNTGKHKSFEEFQRPSDKTHSQFAGNFFCF